MEPYFVVVKHWKDGLSSNCFSFERRKAVSADSSLNCQPFNTYLLRTYQWFSSLRKFPHYLNICVSQKIEFIMHGWHQNHSFLCSIFKHSAKPCIFFSFFFFNVTSLYLISLLSFNWTSQKAPHLQLTTPRENSYWMVEV